MATAATMRPRTKASAAGEEDFLLLLNSPLGGGDGDSYMTALTAKLLYPY